MAVPSGSPRRRLYGELEYIEPTPTIENNVVLYNVLFNVSNGDGLLLPSMTAQVFFVVDETMDALLVPATAVNRGQVSVRNATGEFEPWARSWDSTKGPGVPAPKVAIWLVVSRSNSRFMVPISTVSTGVLLASGLIWPATLVPPP